MATNTPTQTLITDTFSQLVDDVNTISLDLGATGNLTTNQDSDVVGAINELEVGIRGTSNSLVATDLNTSANDLVGAVNELHTKMGIIPDSDGKGNLTNNRIGESIRFLDSAVGDVTSLTTTDKTDVVSAVNELDAELGTITALAMGTTASTVGGAIAELEGEIDTLNTKVEPAQTLTTTATTLSDAINELDAVQGNDSLTTTATTLTGAVNELDAELGDSDMGTTASTVTGAIAELDSDIGARPHTTLTTTAKTLTGAVVELDAEIGSASLNTSATTLRGAINELHTELGATVDSDGTGNNLIASNIGASLRLLDSATGNLASLNTDGSIADRTNLVTAINSVATDLFQLDSDNSLIDSRVGSLSNLDADFVGIERNSVINALNALRADIALIYDENGTQLN